MDLLSHIQDEVPRCVLFGDNIVLLDVTGKRISSKIERWRKTLDSEGFRFSRMKTK